MLASKSRFGDVYKDTRLRRVLTPEALSYCEYCAAVVDVDFLVDVTVTLLPLQSINVLIQM